ncbi:hypothetical protein [Cupriavidus laharis]|nr:hypothetical protein [Cupriavidus laharis]
MSFLRFIPRIADAGYLPGIVAIHQRTVTAGTAPVSVAFRQAW